MTDREDRYLSRAVDAEIDRVLSSGEGGRNGELYRAALSLASLWKGSSLDREQTIGLLTDAGAMVGLPPKEIAATIKSAERKAQPRAVELDGDSKGKGRSAFKPVLRPLQSAPAPEPEPKPKGYPGLLALLKARGRSYSVPAYNAPPIVRSWCESRGIDPGRLWDEDDPYVVLVGDRLTMGIHSTQGCIGAVLRDTTGRAYKKSMAMKGKGRGSGIIATAQVGRWIAGDDSAITAQDWAKGLIIAEGEADLLAVLAGPDPWEGVAFGWRSGALKVLEAVAHRIPSKTAVFIATDDDNQGHRYEDKIHPVLIGRGLRLFKYTPALGDLGEDIKSECIGAFTEITA